MITLERDAEIAVLIIDNPPVNALAYGVRHALLEALRAAESAPDIRAIVVRGAGAHFVAGADIREFDEEPRAPLLNEVLAAVEACSKPIVAALHGAVLGGGLELSLACHGRVGADDASFGMPEIRLGLLPGSGGTQRLPRLIGIEESLALMLSGDPIPCNRAYALGVVDRVSTRADLLEKALAYARELVAAGRELRRLRDEPVRGGMPAADLIEALRAVATRKFPGMAACDSIIECVVASASVPFDAGVALGRARFNALRQSDASRALRHLFFAERGKRPSAAPRPVSAVGVLGAGTMGVGIAISLATAGFEVMLVDLQPAVLATALERIRTTLEASVAKGRLTPAASVAALNRVRSGDRIDVLRDMDFVIEAVFESLAVKQEVFASLGALCRPGVVLASNTSTLDIDAIAQASGRPQDVIGMHFFSPANIMRLVEIVRGRSSAPQVLATVSEVTRRMAKLGIVVGNCFGFVGNRMLYAYGRENQLLMLEGATPTQIDAVMERFGMAMGPNAVGDLAGLDVGYRVRRERRDLPDDPRYYRVADLLVAAGRFGQKNGKGAFDYLPGSRRPTRAPEVEALILAEARRMNVPRREISDEEIVTRCIFALINEGAQILAEGIAASAGDIDAIWCNGYGFPRLRGGPMFYAATLGPAAVVQGIRRLGELHGERYWTPSPLLVKLAASDAKLATWGQQ